MKDQSMDSRRISICWIEDQLGDFINGGWSVLKKDIAERGFELEGEKPIEAKTVDEAERILARFNTPGEKKPDIILLDLMLPQDNEDLEKRSVDLDAGYVIWFQIRHLKKWPALTDIPIIVITARGRPEYMDQVRADRMTRWLPKPADPKTVTIAIVEILSSAEDEHEKPAMSQSSGDSAANKTN
jgi:CheY-like chemotaxis protein